MTKQMMKLATWNLNRPKVGSKAKRDQILCDLDRIDADILVLTETNSCIDLSGKYQTCIASASLFGSLSINGGAYYPGENRVTIWSKFVGQQRLDVCNSHSAICALLDTEWGKLNVYGTVIGIYGKHRGMGEPLRSKTDFEMTVDVQLADWRRLARLGHFCVIGDFNLSFGDNSYVTERHRQRVIEVLQNLNAEVLTKTLKENVDQIALSREFFDSAEWASETWHKQKDKKVSDHHGVQVTLFKI